MRVLKLLEFSLVGFSLSFSVIGSSYGPSVIGSSLSPEWVLFFRIVSNRFISWVISGLSPSCRCFFIKKCYYWAIILFACDATKIGPGDSKPCPNSWFFSSQVVRKKDITYYGFKHIFLKWAHLLTNENDKNFRL